MNKLRRQLADEIKDVSEQSLEGALLTTILRTSGFSKTTKYVKQVFGDLGKRLGFLVSAAGYVHADEGEWMYDMVWYTMRDGILVGQAMVLESELKPGGSVLTSAEVDGDFQKLVQGRAEIRVWVALIPNELLASQHLANCKRQARSFEGAMLEDTYIFIIYNWTTGTTLVEEFVIEVL